jgi:hypothetical protein
MSTAPLVTVQPVGVVFRAVPLLSKLSEKMMPAKLGSVKKRAAIGMKSFITVSFCL